MKEQYTFILSFVLTGLFLISSLSIPSVYASEDNDENAPASFVMASIVPRDTPEGEWLYLSYNEAFRRLNLSLDFQHYQSTQASEMADQHKVEGELARSYHYGKNHPQLIRVEEHGISSLTLALATNPEIKLDGWASLLDTPYRVDYLRGSERTHEKLSEVVKPALLSSVSEWSQGFKKLLDGKTDVFVVPEIITRYHFAKDEFRNSNIRSVGVMEVITIHAYLHKSNAALARNLSETLKEMKKEGLISKYRKLAGVE